MLEQVAKKSLIISIILILLAAIISVSVLSINNVAFAEEENPEEEVDVRNPSSNSSCILRAKNSVVNTGNASSTFYGVTIYVEETAENVTIKGSLRNSEIIVEQRTTDVNITLMGNISGYDSRCLIYNKSTKGTVHIINGSSSAINILGKLRYTTGHMLDDADVYGVVASRGNISFEGSPINISCDIPVVKSTGFGNLDFGATGLQVFGAKNVYIKTNVTITGGNGAEGLTIGVLHTDGGHGGYAYDGALARVHVPSGHLTLIGGKGGNGANAPAGEIPGLKGYGGFAYYLNIISSDKSRITTKNGANGSNGHNV